MITSLVTRRRSTLQPSLLHARAVLFTLREWEGSAFGEGYLNAHANSFIYVSYPNPRGVPPARFPKYQGAES